MILKDREIASGRVVALYQTEEEFPHTCACVFCATVANNKTLLNSNMFLRRTLYKHKDKHKHNDKGIDKDRDKDNDKDKKKDKDKDIDKTKRQRQRQRQMSEG